MGAKESEMTGPFEYKDISIWHALGDHANEQARDGWELTHVFERHEKGHFQMLFRRPKPPPVAVTPPAHGNPLAAIEPEPERVRRRRRRGNRSEWDRQ